MSNMRLTWKVNGEAFSVTLFVTGQLQELALEQLLAGLVMTGHTDAKLQRESTGWVDVE